MKKCVKTEIKTNAINPEVVRNHAKRESIPHSTSSSMFLTNKRTYSSNQRSLNPIETSSQSPNV